MFISNQALLLSVIIAQTLADSA